MLINQDLLTVIMPYADPHACLRCVYVSKSIHTLIWKHNYLTTKSQQEIKQFLKTNHEFTDKIYCTDPLHDLYWPFLWLELYFKKIIRDHIKTKAPQDKIYIYDFYDNTIYSDLPLRTQGRILIKTHSRLEAIYKCITTRKYNGEILMNPGYYLHVTHALTTWENLGLLDDNSIETSVPINCLKKVYSTHHDSKFTRMIYRLNEIRSCDTII
jgi:hypothetical protein